MWNAPGIGKGSLCWADGMLYLFTEEARLGLARVRPKG